MRAASHEQAQVTGAFNTRTPPPQISMHPTDTAYDIKRLVGRRFDDPTLQKDLERFPFKVWRSNAV